MTWRRLWRAIRADKVLLASLIAAIVLVASIVVGPPIISAVLGHTSDQPFPYATDPIKRVPVGPFAHVWDTSQE